MLPALSQIRAWSTEHLIEAANYWTTTADRWEDVFLQLRNESHTLVWEGAGGDALPTRTGADLDIVSPKADQLRQASTIARAGAGTIGACQRRVIYAVEDAHNAGFAVEEDISVTDTRISRSAAEQASRHAQAQSLAADIRLRATQLIAIEQEVAARIAAATAGIAATTFPETPLDHRPHIHAVDRTWKQDPAPSPPAPGPAGLSADDIRRVLDKLPFGDRPFIREVRSPEDLQNLWEWARQNGVEIPNGYGDPSIGTRYQLPDGTTIGQRWAGESTGRPVLDVRLPGKDGHVKVHINPRGGTPDFPPPAGTAPSEAPPVRAPSGPPLVARPPVEPVPGRAGSTPPLVGLTAVPPESIPHPVHPPHTHHGPPVLGKDELPDLDEFTPG